MKDVESPFPAALLFSSLWSRLLLSHIPACLLAPYLLIIVGVGPLEAVGPTQQLIYLNYIEGGTSPFLDYSSHPLHAEGRERERCVRAKAPMVSLQS